MSLGALIFFAIFAVVLVAMYLAVRRRWLPPMLIGGVGVFSSILMMVLFSLAQGNVPAQAIATGFAVGGILSVATLVVALYFQGNELRDKQGKR